MSSEDVKNVIFLGSTGSGRSSTCNTISGLTKGPFSVNHKPVSEETHANYYVSESKNIRLIDTPGFGDSKISETKIDEILKQLASTFGGKIHAFVLVVKINSHAETLPSDIDRIRDVFGDAALKNLIILPIYTSNQKQDFLKELNKYDQVIKAMKKAKGEEPNQNWFCLWNNQKPRENQEYEFFEKINNLEPYIFDKSKIFDQKFPKVNQVKEEYLEFQKHQKETQKILEATARINLNTKSILDQVYARMRKESEESTNKFLEKVNSKHNSFYPPLDSFLEENKKMIEQFRSNLKENAKHQKEPPEPKGIGDLAMDIIKTPSKREQAEKAKELTGAAAKKGAEKVAEKGATGAVKKVAFFSATKVCNIF